MAGAHRNETWSTVARATRRAGVAVAGSTVAVTGVVLLVAPGPGVPLVVLGLMILAREFDWASRGLERLRRRLDRARNGRSSVGHPSPPGTVPAGLGSARSR